MSNHGVLAIGRRLECRAVPRQSHGDVLSAFSQAWASWKTAPGVALLAVVAFAVGIGSATAIFTVISGVLFRPLPYPNSERYVSLYGTSATTPGSMMGMSMMSLLVSVPTRLTVKHFARTHLALRGLAGLFSVGLGLFIVYENGGVSRLFA